MKFGGRSWVPWDRPAGCMLHDGECPECRAVEYKPTRFLEKPSVPSEHIYRAPHAIVDEELERIVFSPGDPMSYEDAVKYGVIEPDDDARNKSERSRRKGKDRAKHPAVDRAIKPEEDR